MINRLQVVLSILLLGATAAGAEPYPAVRTDQTCSACHVKPAGGGLRSEFGAVFGQRILARRPLESGSSATRFSLLDSLSFGDNVRFNAQQLTLEGVDGNLEFHRVNLYASLVLNVIVSLYVDQQVAPGGSLNREV